MRGILTQSHLEAVWKPSERSYGLYPLKTTRMQMTTMWYAWKEAAHWLVARKLSGHIFLRSRTHAYKHFIYYRYFYFFFFRICYVAINMYIYVGENFFSLVVWRRHPIRWFMHVSRCHIQWKNITLFLCICGFAACQEYIIMNTFMYICVVFRLIMYALAWYCVLPPALVKLVINA